MGWKASIAEEQSYLNVQVFMILKRYWMRMRFASSYQGISKVKTLNCVTSPSAKIKKKN